MEMESKKKIIKRVMKKLKEADKNEHFPCDSCNKTFTKKYNLERHKASVHQSNEKTKFICNECSALIARKDQLIRHLRIHQNTLSIKSEHSFGIHHCQDCPKSFSRKDQLTRHQRVHRKGSDIKIEGKIFICAECSKTFRRKDQLCRHVQTHLIAKGFEDNTKTYNCFNCSASFKRKDHLFRHVRTHQFANSIFTCQECSKSFCRKDQLIRHLRIHKDPSSTDNVKNIYECSYCHRGLASERRLILHQHKEHGLDSGKTFLECNECSLKFPSKKRLELHNRIVHAPDKEALLQRRRPKLDCLECDQFFRTRQALLKHYEQDHNIKVEYEYLLFKSKEEFDKWLSPYYRFKTVWVTSTDTCVERFRCHRSGIHRQSAQNNQQRKRQVTSKKLRGFCPGEVTLRQRRSDGLCVVMVQKVHVGHSIDDVEELRYVYLNKAEKEEIANQMAAGVPKETILQNFYRPSDAKKDIANVPDIDNIASACGLNDLLPIKNDMEYIEKFVSDHADSILYFKKENEPDELYNLFKPEDFVLIFQDSFQKECLEKYGHHIIAFDVTHHSNSPDLLIHSMLVLNTENQGVATAFLVANRKNQDLIDIFVQCIRKRVGIIDAKTIMFDTDMLYYNAWHSFMNVPEFSLYCVWHVKKTWKLRLNELVKLPSNGNNYKARAKNRRKRIHDLKIKLFDLAKEQDEVLFKSKLHSLLSIEERELQPFLRYFRNNYVDNQKFWAACYRSSASINYNMHMERFHRTLKYKVSGREKILTLSAGLRFINLYITYRDNKRHTKSNRSTLTTRLRELSKRHAAAEEYAEKQPFSIEYDPVDQIWQVGFFSNESQGVMEMYSVQKNDTKECGYSNWEECSERCESCQSCCHEYQCCCSDSAIANNMCQHIHALCLFLAHQSVDELENTMEVTPYVIENLVDTEDLQTVTINVSTELECVNSSLVDVDECIDQEFVRIKGEDKSHFTLESHEQWHAVQEHLRHVAPTVKVVENEPNDVAESKLGEYLIF